MQTSTTISQIALPVVLAAAVISGVLAVSVRKWQRGRALGRASQGETPYASAVVAYYTAGHELINAGSGVADGIHYGMYLTAMTENQNETTFVHESAVIYILNLPYNTQVHLMGLSKSFGLDRLQFASFLAGSGMVQIQLADTALDHFDLYQDADSGVQMHPILDPAALAFVRKYCASHFWELHDSELYFVVTDVSIGDSNFIIESQQFAEALRTALPTSTTNAPVTHHEVPYDIYDGPALACPICRKNMQLHDDTWFMCVDQHGVLLAERDLARLNNHEASIAITANQAIHHGPLSCPHCQHSMALVPYGKTNLELDSCTNCAFHWLDADKVVTLTASRKKRRLH